MLESLAKFKLWFEWLPGEPARPAPVKRKIAVRFLGLSTGRVVVVRRKR